MNQEDIICKNCGTINTSSDRHCQSCGKSLVTVDLVDDVTMVSQKNYPPQNSSSSHMHGFTVLGGNFKGAKTRKWWFILPSILLAIIVIFSLFVFGNHLLPQTIPQLTPTPTPNIPLGIGKDGIGVTLVDGEYIGISDGRYAFDANQPLMLQASESLRNGNPGPALSQWNAAHEKETNNAEPLIYIENQRVLASGSPYITIVLGRLSLGVNLQAAYLVQKEYNKNSQLAGGKKLRLLIAKSGSNTDRSKDIARQVVLAAQHDKTIVGVQGWGNSEATLDVVGIVASAHLPIVASDAASNDLTGISPYFFRVGVSSAVNAPLKATYVEKKLAPRHLVIFKDDAEPYSRDSAADFSRQFTQGGYQIASTEDFKTAEDAQDGHLAQHVRDVLTAYKPDFIFMATNAVSDVTTVLNTIPATVEYASLKVFAGSAGYELVRSGEKVPGYTHMLLSSSAFPDEWSILAPENPEPPFFKDYIAAYDPRNEHISSPYTYRRADAGVMVQYDALSVFLVASKTATQQGMQDPTPEDIKKALSQINSSQPFQGITGAIAFGTDGDPINKVRLILHVVDGGYTRVAAYQGCLLVNSSPCDNTIHILE